MTFSTLLGVLDAGAIIDVAQPDQVRWCGSRGCWARYRATFANERHHRLEPRRFLRRLKLPSGVRG